MTDNIENTIEILGHLVGFKTISGTSTCGIIDYISQYLAEHEVPAHLSYDQDGERANLFATIGPEIDGGVLVNGHTDVVPVTGQNWSTDPFKLTRKGDRLYGRGSVDMKGFLACVLACVPTWKNMALKSPIHIAFSYDEEIGGLGMPVLIDAMAGKPFKPNAIIVGEPTDMKIVSGHKGGYEFRTEITGLETHSSNPTLGVNAISYAMRLIGKIEEIGQRISENPIAGSPFIPPYSTFNIGTINGGTARNATAGFCVFDWEYRPMPGENSDSILAEIDSFIQDVLLPEMKRVHSGAKIELTESVLVPALNNEKASDAVSLICALTGENSENVVSFGTDAGHFSDADYSTVVFGPGSISRAHKPDEYIEVAELIEGLSFLDKLGKHLSR